MNEVVMKHRSHGILKGILVACIAMLLAMPGLTGTVDAQVRSDVRALLDEGINLFQQGKLDEARQSFERALLLDITSEEALDWVDKLRACRRPKEEGRLFSLLEGTRQLNS